VDTDGSIILFAVRCRRDVPSPSGEGGQGDRRHGMGEKGIPLQGASMDALVELATAAKAPAPSDPVDLLASWPLQTIQDAVRDTPELANKWMEAYMNWREIEEQRAADRAARTPPRQGSG
jgi:hypothetical protein